MIRIGPEERGDPIAGFAIGVDDGPIGMSRHGVGIPDARIVHIQGHTTACRHVPPDAQRIADEPGDVMSDLRRIARHARVSFAVGLQVIGMHQVNDLLDHFGCGVLADFLAVFARMEVEMDSQEAVGSLESRRIFGIRDTSGREQPGQRQGYACEGLSHRTIDGAHWMGGSSSSYLCYAGGIRGGPL